MPIFIASPNLNPNASDEVELLLFDDTGSSIADGSKLFFEQILKDIGITATVSKWNLEVCRSDYFSDYLGENDWRDVWRTTWKANVKISEKVNSISEMKDVFIESEAKDESWDYQKRITGNSITHCLVVCDFDSLADLEESVDHINKMKLETSSDYVKPGIKLKTIKIMGQYYQLQIDLGEVKPTFFSNGAIDAKAIQKICRQEGGTTNYKERFP